MSISFDFDFKNPNYGAVWEHRTKMLLTIRENPEMMDGIKQYYKNNIAQFITDWGVTYDPRNADIGLPTTLPFVLFEKQEEYVNWIIERWKKRENGLGEKSREVGVSWLTIATACSLALFYEGTSYGFGSRKEEYVDKIGDPKSLFWKARFFMSGLPTDFRGSWNVKQCCPYMRILFPESGSSITGEAGDNIGRGDRKSIYFVDEAAYIERPGLIEASLSATTNCRIDVSSANGMANPFAQKIFAGKISKFTFHWRDDPRKDEIWYAKQKEQLDPVTLAQEVDINYSASVEGIVIPSEWVQSAIDACAKLNIEPTGMIESALDVADQGIDLNAMATKRGIELFDLQEWSGKESDTVYTTERAFSICDETGAERMQYDADGLGAFVRGDSRVINDRRRVNNERQIGIVAFRGSGAVILPEKETVKGRKNKDYFLNFKAQAWWSLRFKFQQTHRAVIGQLKDFNPEEIISISSKLKLLSKLLMELPQPTFTITTTGKIQIDKAPDNTRSPNLADSVNMVYSPRRSSGLFS